MVHDTGLRWTIGPITPVVELLKNTEIFPRVRSLAVRAIYLFVKEGDRVLGLLSQVIAHRRESRCCLFFFALQPCLQRLYKAYYPRMLTI